MRIALGVHVSTYEVTASLVDTSLPELGPIATRTVAVAATPGGIGGAVSTALGFMRVQAMQNDLAVAGAAVVCENALQREIVADALAEVEAEPPPVVDIFDERLSDAFTPDVSAALLVGDIAPPGPLVKKPRTEHRGIWPVAAVSACILAALGGVTAWAMTTDSSPTGETTVPAELVYPTGVAVSPSTSVSGSAAPTVEPSAELEAPEVVPGFPPVDVVAPRPPEVVPIVPPAPRATSPNPVEPTPPPTRTTTTTTTPSTPGGGGGSATTTPTESEPEPTTSEPELPTPEPTEDLDEN